MYLGCSQAIYVWDVEAHTQIIQIHTTIRQLVQLGGQVVTLGFSEILSLVFKLGLVLVLFPWLFRLPHFV